MITSAHLFAILALICFCRCDELISARCQSMCLRQMDQRLQDVAEHRKNLKHHIIQMCKDDEACSACSTPCREQFDDVAECKSSCKTFDDDDTRDNCELACEYLHNIYSEKPGQCPIQKNGSNYECTALCHLDGDCPETQKCCAVGCNRQCVKPDASAVKLLPIPRNISVQERKRKRSVIVRWSTGKLSKRQQADNSNLFVIQWRWGLHTEAESMTEWQTVTVRNKPYAILKHLLSAGRYYQFRVAAVSHEGSLGFSAPSVAFKMSKEAKAPPPPRDITVGAVRLTPIGLWNQVVEWNPPPSDLPIKNYQISWAASTKEEANAFETMMRKQSTIERSQHEKRSLDDEEEWGINDRDRHSVIVPSHSTNAEISGLFPKSVYIVEIHATVDSSDGELHGEKGIVFVRTPETSTTTPTPPPARISHDSEELTMIEEDSQIVHTQTHPTLDVQTPFYDGELMTNLKWTSARCNDKSVFSVRVRKTLCREYQPNHHSDTRWHDLRVNECSALLKGLSFDCDYKVEVSSNGSPIVDGVFSTTSCEQTNSLSPIECDALTTPIRCMVLSQNAATCHWNRHHDSMQTVIGYRILLSSPMGHDTNITINQPQLREVRYEELNPGFVYNVEVQSITNKGLGKTFSTQFVTHSDHHLIERFPGGEIIELPLESSASVTTMVSLTSLLLLLFIRI